MFPQISKIGLAAQLNGVVAKINSRQLTLEEYRAFTKIKGKVCDTLY